MKKHFNRLQMGCLWVLVAVLSALTILFMMFLFDTMLKVCAVLVAAYLLGWLFEDRVTVEIEEGEECKCYKS